MPIVVEHFHSFPWIKRWRWCQGKRRRGDWHFEIWQNPPITESAQKKCYQAIDVAWSFRQDIFLNLDPLKRHNENSFTRSISASLTGNGSGNQTPGEEAAATHPFSWCCSSQRLHLLQKLPHHTPQFELEHSVFRNISCSNHQEWKFSGIHLAQMKDDYVWILLSWMFIAFVCVKNAS